MDQQIQVPSWCIARQKKDTMKEKEVGKGSFLRQDGY